MPGVHGDFAAVGGVFANDDEIGTAVAAGLQLNHDDKLAFDGQLARHGGRARIAFPLAYERFRALRVSRQCEREKNCGNEKSFHGWPHFDCE